MKLLASILCLTGVIVGQSLQATVTFVPFGPWPICKTAQSIPYLKNFFGSANYCVRLTSGSEPDLLSIKSSNPSTTDFVYTATGVDSAGASKTVTGHFARKDNSAGFSSTIVNAGLTTALVTWVEYSYDPAAGSFLMLQTSSAYYKYSAYYK
jgi:hypothetical protein